MEAVQLMTKLERIKVLKDELEYIYKYTEHHWCTFSDVQKELWFFT